MQFFKAHALGNDFILIKTSNINSITQEQVLKLNHRFTGIGCNQILIVDQDHNVKIWDEDGSIAPLCGNGLRCLAKLLNKPLVTLNTISGPVHLKNINNLMEMEIEKTPTITKEKECYLVDIGNLHRIFLIEDNTKIKIEKYTNQKINYSFLSRINNQWKIRTMECCTKFETFACGSASFASACVLNELNYKDLKVHYKLGAIDHRIDHQKIIQIGPATIVAELKFSDDFIKFDLKNN